LDESKSGIIRCFPATNTGPRTSCTLCPNRVLERRKSAGYKAILSVTSSRFFRSMTKTAFRWMHIHAWLSLWWRSEEQFKSNRSVYSTNNHGSNTSRTCIGSSGGRTELQVAVWRFCCAKTSSAAMSCCWGLCPCGC
jgi:hypothetical protein